MPLVDYPALFLKADNARNSGQVASALQHYAEIARLAEDEGRLEELAQALHMAGVAVKERADSPTSSFLRDAQQYFQQAAEVYNQTQQASRLGALYRDWAGACVAAQQDQRALDYFQKSITQLSNTDEFGELGSTYDKIGKFYALRNDFETAETYYQKALDCFKKDPTAGFYWATTLYDYALLHCQTQNFHQAETLLEESLGWFKADHELERFDQRLAQIYGSLSLVKAKQDDSRSAKNYGQLYLNYSKKLDPEVARNLQAQLDQLFA